MTLRHRQVRQTLADGSLPSRGRWGTPEDVGKVVAVQRVERCLLDRRVIMVDGGLTGSTTMTAATLAASDGREEPDRCVLPDVYQ